jgi:hypothetical protein
MPSKHEREEGLGDDEGAVPPLVIRAKSSRGDDNDDDEEGEDGHAAAAAAVGQFDSWLSERHAVLEALQRDVDDPPWMLPPAHGVEMTTGASRPPRSTFKFDGRKWKVNEQREGNAPSHLFWRDDLPWEWVNEDRYGQSVSQSMRSSRLDTSATNDLFCCAPITRQRAAMLCLASTTFVCDCVVQLCMSRRCTYVHECGFMFVSPSCDAMRSLAHTSG